MITLARNNSAKKETHFEVRSKTFVLAGGKGKKGRKGHREAFKTNKSGKKISRRERKKFLLFFLPFPGTKSNFIWGRGGGGKRTNFVWELLIQRIFLSPSFFSPKNSFFSPSLLRDSFQIPLFLCIYRRHIIFFLWKTNIVWPPLTLVIVTDDQKFLPIVRKGVGEYILPHTQPTTHSW